MLKESDRLTYFQPPSAPMTWQPVHCVDSTYNIRNEVTVYRQHINSLLHAGVFTTCYELETKKGEKRLGTVVHGGKPGKVGMKQGQKTVQGR